MGFDRDEPSARSADMTATLVARLRDGKTDAADLLVKLYREKLICYCHGYLGDRNQAEDVVQEVFLRVLKSRDVPENFRAWIYKISRNCSLDLLRSRGRRKDNGTLPTGSHLNANLTGNLTRLVRQERWEKLRQLVEELPDSQREVLHLRYAEGLSRMEIAEVLDMDVKLVKSRLYHAMEKLRLHDSLADGS